MQNFVAVMFDDPRRAYKGLHALWQLDEAGEITVHGTTVVHRDDAGHFEVDAKETHAVGATAAGVGIGALLGALAGQAGLAIDAATGAVIGGAVDLDSSDTRRQAAIEAGFVIGRGQSAVIADISEDTRGAIDMRMQGLDGSVHRRAKASLQDDAARDIGFYPYDSYLYPYEYIPSRYSAERSWG